MLGRRDFLRVGLGAAALPWTQEVRTPARSVVWLWMAGGPSQTDTWDPKPGEAGVELFKAIDTAVPGIRVSELLPRCAAQMGRLAVVRTTTLNTDRYPRMDMHTGRSVFPQPEFAPAGTIIAHERGNRDLALPPYIALGPTEIPVVDCFGEWAKPRRLESILPNLVPGEREQERRALLDDLSREWESTRRQQGVEEMRAARAGAEALMKEEVRKVLDLGQEPEELRKNYGEGFGQDCLLARRLVQAGCPFVEVGLDGWNPEGDYAEGVRRAAARLDAGLGTLVRDLAEKDLLGRTVVVCCGAHGRHPVLDRGRRGASWTTGFSTVLAGGGIRGGQVYGDTGKRGLDCDKPVTPARLIATVFQACGLRRGTYITGGHKWTYLAVNVTPLVELF